MKKNNSYSQILKASSIMGGSAGIIMLLSMIKTKFAAVIIGVIGVGLLNSFTSLQSLITTITGLGIKSSAVREIALFASNDDKYNISLLVRSLNRISLLSGIFGMILVFLLSPYISELTFNNPEYTFDIAMLGFVILFTNIYGAQMAILQGMRKIDDMAKVQIIGALFATVSAVCFYNLLGLEGIIPSLITISISQVIISWFYVKKININKIKLPLIKTFSVALNMITLGLVFMWTGLIKALIPFVTISLISNQIDILAVGIYSAAFALSGLFVGFVLQAMSADYYPRLTGVSNDKTAMNILANEQSEIGLLLALPGLIATVVFANFIVSIFYSSEFLQATELIPWFILGALGRVVSWPLGYIMIAMKKNKLLILSETLMSFFNIALIYFSLKYFGIKGVAISFFIFYLIHILVVYIISKRLTGFSWKRSLLRDLLFTSVILIIIFEWSNDNIFSGDLFFGIFVFLIVSIYSLLGLVNRIGPEHKLSKVLYLFTYIKKLLIERKNKIE